MTEEKPSKDLFERLRVQDPERLIAWLSDGSLEHHLLTYAAEFAGDVPSDYVEKAREALLDLLAHQRAYVREGAVYGLSKLPVTQEVMDALTKLTSNLEPSTDVRETAMEALVT